MDVLSLLYWDVGSHFSWFALSILRSSGQWLASTVIGLHVLPLLNSGAECFLTLCALLLDDCCLLPPPGCKASWASWGFPENTPPPPAFHLVLNGFHC